MATSTTTGMAYRRAGWARIGADWLAYAAAPAFALMALVAAADPTLMLCLPQQEVSRFGAMTVMYLLMSFFHLPPWLGLFASIGRVSNDH
ncbi:hypothetical protein [Castellaniella sp. GW247-6E4]|uniref:hypothetical protein n=1 Tax=Castellaniella sp. GW247-6E4 TaxID=3140380 RepID=UPI0033146C11